MSTVHHPAEGGAHDRSSLVSRPSGITCSPQTDRSSAVLEGGALGCGQRSVAAAELHSSDLTLETGSRSGLAMLIYARVSNAMEEQD
ncbi:hypothetical protein EYF80_026889 [Liparis tanakae]|uniref:Uncharacterized protein n=1 Tax=Liparis tanakae TaxID=230148 RepID=A0A4Z2HD47_9TELE|nr:hypothetical protein EYF80_026889 [Liparis tanakae]